MEFIFELFKTIIIGIVQGITEFLPISSTGHMLLLDEFLKLGVSEEFKSMFFVVIQFGSILAVCLLYFYRLNPFASHKAPNEKQETFTLWSKVVVAAIPAGLLGLFFDDFIDSALKGPIVIAIMLIVYGIIFLVVENMRRKPTIRDLNHLDYKTAFGIGVFQIAALIPGTSRSGSTIVGAMLLGCSRGVAAEFSFFLAIPMMVAASGMKLVKYFISGNIAFGALEITILLVGTFVAFVVSIIAIRLLMGYIKKHDFKVFGYYRIVLGILVLIYFVPQLLK